MGGSDKRRWMGNACGSRCERMGVCSNRECCTDITSSPHSGDGMTAAVSGMQGWRPSMEDHHHMRCGMGPKKDTSLFCVFDGHGGDYAAAWASTQLSRNINAALNEPSAQDASAEQLTELLRQITLQTDEELRAASSFTDRSGCTVVMALVTPTHIVVGNLGDSRVVLASAGTTIALTNDHKPTDEKELARIYKANSVVVHGRVNRDLNLSRSLGDFRHKTFKEEGNYIPSHQPISPDPDFAIRERDASKDEFLILACDGIWDVMSNQTAVAFCRKALRDNSISTVTEMVLETCLELGSMDNMTAMVVMLKASSKA